MKTIDTHLRYLWLLAIASFCLGQALAANGPVPSAIDKGFQLLKTAGPVAAFDAWRDGGALLNSSKAQDESNNFKEMVKPLRDFRSYEVIEIKEIGKTSKILYLATTFERGVLYGSFLVWKSDRDWVVQHMTFNTKPEVIMPWLVLGAGK